MQTDADGWLVILPSSVGAALRWALNILGQCLLGVHWEQAKAITIICLAFVPGAAFLYGLDIVLLPLLWAWGYLCRVRRRWSAVRSGDPAPVRYEDLGWRGPAADDELDNDFYRDAIRGRNAQRKANHLLSPL